MSNADMPPFLYRHIMRGMQDGYPTAPPRLRIFRACPFRP